MLKLLERWTFAALAEETFPGHPDLRPPLTKLDGLEIRHLFSAGTAWLERHAPYVNSLNVFPVPDGDSGTNMLLTMQAALREVDSSPAHSVSEILNALSRGALLGARGNSGVILSQIIRGLAHSLDKKSVMTTADLAAGLLEGSATAYKGVVKPVEGTILTVIREAAEGTRRAVAQSDDLRVVLEQTVQSAREAVLNTPNLLPVLKEAGVVDAGGEGLYILLEGAYKYLKGEPMQMAAPGVGAENLAQLTREEGWGYDIQFHIRGFGLDVDKVRETISGMGESALIVGDESLIKVHVHAPNPGEIVKYGAEQGALVNIIIENMQEQYVDFMAGGTADRRVGAENLAGRPLAIPTETVSPMTTVAVASGAGLQTVFESLGASAVVDGGQSNNPSTQDILNAIERVHAEQVLVLPNNKNIILTSQQAQNLTAKRVAVVPTRTVPQGIAALLAFNFQADLETNAQTMLSAAQRVRTLEVTFATRSVSIDGVDVREGQAIGLVDGDLAGASDDRLELIFRLLNKMEAGASEIITVYYGEAANAAEVESLAARLQTDFPHQSLELHAGNQPVYPYIVSVE